MIEGKIIFWIAASAYGVFAWWVDRKKKKEAEELEKRIRENELAAGTTAPGSPAVTLRPVPQTPPASQISEQERLRRFLEALGVPGGQAPSPAPRPTSPLPSQTRPAPVPRQPVPPRTVPSSLPQVRERGQVPASVRPAPQPIRPPAPVYREAAPEPVYRDAQPAAAGEMATVSIGEAARYEHVVVPKFVASQMKTTPAASVERTSVPASNVVRELLKTPGNLRAAILLREILGPAPGL